MQQDNTYNHLHSLVIKNPNLVVVSGEKESSVVIMNKIDYQNKNRKIINGGLTVSYTGISKSRVNMKKFAKVKFGQLYGITETHTFKKIEDITLENLKFCSTIA